MNPVALSRKSLIRAVIVIIVIAGILFTAHTLANHVDALAFLQHLHGR